MVPRSLAISTCLILASGIHPPSSGSADDRSPTGLLREASTYAAKGKDSALLGILLLQQKVGGAAGAMITAELDHGNSNNAWAIVVAIQASKGNITGAKESLARISQKTACANALSHIAIAYTANAHPPGVEGSQGKL